MYPIGAREESSTVPTGSKPEPICERPVSVIWRSVLSKTGVFSEERSLGVAHEISPPQKAASFVLGVDPPTTSTSSPIVDVIHPSGLPSSIRASGTRDQISAARYGARPSSLARVGPKSTNQSLK